MSHVSMRGIALAVWAAAMSLCPSCRAKSGQGHPPAVTVSVQPSTAGVNPAGEQRFAATVTGAADTAVRWSVVEGSTGGAIDATGRYLAPPTDGTYHVVATSVADPSKSATASVVVGTVYTLPSDRVTTWKPGVTYNGGIPHRTTICRTLSPLGGGRDDTAQIQKAIDECPDESVVELTAGTFELGGDGYTYADAHLYLSRSNLTLRGTLDANGEPATTLRTPCTYAEGETLRCNTAVVVGTLWVHPDEESSVALAADVAKESKQVTVASNPGYQVGELVLVDEETDPGLTWWNPDRCGESNPGGCRDWFIRSNRPVGQVNEIAAVNGNVLTFSAPFHMPFRRSKNAQVTRYDQVDNGRMPVTRAGVEDLKVSGGGGGDGGGNIHFFGATYSWARNVEAERSEGTSVNLDASFRCELRDSYVHSTVNPTPGGGGYGIGFNTYAADNLVENTISWNFDKVMLMRASGGGNVIAYSYFEDGWIAYDPTFVESGLNASHYTTSHMELFEGNLAFNFSSDSTWGNAIYVTAFRNHFTGLRGAIPPLDRYEFHYTNGAGDPAVLYYEDLGGRCAVSVGPNHWWNAFVGNVLGYDGQQPSVARSPGMGGQDRFVYELAAGDDYVAPMWSVGFLNGVQEPKTVATLIRHGNFDYLTRSQVWDPDNAIHLLPSSLYLDGPPGFMAGLEWPWVDPATGATYTLPAKARFDRLHGLN